MAIATVKSHTSYAGIGSRETPADVQRLMTAIARSMSRAGYTLRSGAAGGADMAFEAGATRKEIYLPWRGFNGHTSVRLPAPKAFDLAAKHHPNWSACSEAARKLHARNCHQVLGAKLDDPVLLVICWTPNASGSGGTGQAIRIARAHNIPVFDLADPNAEGALRLFLS